MGGWAEECADCGELNYEDDMTEVGGEYYCSGCAEEHELDGADPDDKLKSCQFCRKSSLEKEFIEKLEGVMCKKCAHKREVEIAGFDDMNCAICDHKAILKEVPACA